MTPELAEALRKISDLPDDDGAWFVAVSTARAALAAHDAAPRDFDFGKSFAATVASFDSLPAASQLDYYRAKAKADAAALTAATERAERLLSALTFYAHDPYWGSPTSASFVSAISQDGGKIARRAIASDTTTQENLK